MEVIEEVGEQNEQTENITLPNIGKKFIFSNNKKFIILLIEI